MTTIRDEVNAIQERIVMNHKELSWLDILSHFKKTKHKNQSSEQIDRDYQFFIEELTAMLRNILSREKPESEKYEEKLYDAAYFTLMMVLNRCYIYLCQKPQCLITLDDSSSIMLAPGKAYQAEAIKAWAEKYPNDPPPGMNRPFSKREMQYATQYLKNNLYSDMAWRGTVAGFISGSFSTFTIMVIGGGIIFAANPIGAAVIGVVIGLITLGCIAVALYEAYQKYKKRLDKAKISVEIHKPKIDLGDQPPIVTLDSSTAARIKSIMSHEPTVQHIHTATFSAAQPIPPATTALAASALPSKPLAATLFSEKAAAIPPATTTATVSEAPRLV